MSISNFIYSQGNIFISSNLCTAFEQITLILSYTRIIYLHEKIMQNAEYTEFLHFIPFLIGHWIQFRPRKQMSMLKSFKIWLQCLFWFKIISPHWVWLVWYFATASWALERLTVVFTFALISSSIALFNVFVTICFNLLASLVLSFLDLTGQFFFLVIADPLVFLLLMLLGSFAFTFILPWAILIHFNTRKLFR